VNNVNLVWLCVPIITGIVAVIFAAYLARWVLSQDTGTPAMQRVAGFIFNGAQAFLRRQYQTISILAVVVAVIIFIVLLALPQTSSLTSSSNSSVNHTPFNLAWHTALAFLIGATCSGLAGYIGMLVAVRSNIRVASAAQRSLGQALVVALRGGAVTGFLVIALSLLGVTLVYMAFGGLSDPQGTTTLIVGFGFGASFVALFAQLGGGIYTKAADVGADLVGKVEAGIPEDDPRNPAVIADLVGDNVGDCAGRGADLFESTAAENIGAMILGSSVATTLAGASGHLNTGWIILPLVAVGIGIIASLIGVLAVRGQGLDKPNIDGSTAAMGQMNLGFYITAALAAVGMILVTYFLLHDSTDNWWYFALAGLVGLANTFAFVFITQYYTSGSWRPVRLIADSTLTGPATTIITGLAIGFENTGLPSLAIALSLGSAYALGSAAGVGGTHGIISTGGIYATAIATVGMLMAVGYILAMDSFGPITDNAGGIVEMSNAPESTREITDALDSVGNTTKALTKGYGIGSAALAAFLLIGAYLNVLAEGSNSSQAANYIVNLADPPIFIAGLIGATLIFVFSSLAMRAVGQAAQGMITEVRRQFKADAGIMAGTSDPDYARCVDISTRSALRQMVLPGALVVVTPILVGVILGPEAAAGLLIVGTIAGIMMALVMNNGGGAWDNAKKYIESGKLVVNGVVMKKGSDAHAAAVVGDTIGDPFKDTAGPSLHVVIKLLSTITLVLAPLYIFLHK
jgi:K(+)-stimulated pyrophosphate-energized sodium pump